MNERRRSQFLQGLVDDPYRKLLAVGLAVLVWFFIDSRITRQITRTIPLVCIGAQEMGSEAFDRLAVILPTNKVVGLRFLDGEEVIDRIEVVLSGPRFTIDAIEGEPLNLAITTFLARDWVTSSTVEFTAADIRRDQRSLQNVRMELRPTRVRLEVERIERAVVLLNSEVVDVQAEQLADRLLPQTATYSPSEAMILGPAIGIEKLKRRSGKLFRAVLRSVGNEKQARAELEILDGDELGLRFESRPLLSIQLLPQTSTFVVNVPILVDDLALPPELRGAYRPDEPLRTVRLRAGGALLSLLVGLSEGPDRTRLNEWAAQNLRLLVHVARPEGGAFLGDRIERQARIMLVGRMYAQVERNECQLDSEVVVPLRRNP